MLRSTCCTHHFSSQIHEKRLAKAKGAQAKLKENYKIQKEIKFRETMIIRSGFAFDAPSAPLRSAVASGDCCAMLLHAPADRNRRRGSPWPSSRRKLKTAFACFALQICSVGVPLELNFIVVAVGLLPPPLLPPVAAPRHAASSLLRCTRRN